MTIEKTGNVSTLDHRCPYPQNSSPVEATLPPQLKIRPLDDQSIFVRAAINDVAVEALDCRLPYRNHDSRFSR